MKKPYIAIRVHSFRSGKDTDWDELEKLVEAAMAEGYVPLGGAFIVPLPFLSKHAIEIVQTMWHWPPIIANSKQY